jgi:hypothetical protein
MEYTLKFRGPFHNFMSYILLSLHNTTHIDIHVVNSILNYHFLLRIYNVDVHQTLYKNPYQNYEITNVSILLLNLLNFFNKNLNNY